jgi:hypothetical protein
MRKYGINRFLIDKRVLTSAEIQVLTDNKQAEQDHWNSK